MNVEVVVLAAGEGKRMRSALPKVLHPLAGKPLLQRVLETALALAPARCHVVTGGRGADRVRAAMSRFDVNWVTQEPQLGTGHAVSRVLPRIGDDSVVLILPGDVPLVARESLEKLLRGAGDSPALLTARLARPAGYGRVLRDRDGNFERVVEERDADERQRRVDEINTGILAAPAALLKDWLPRLGNDNAQREYYLPDILSLAVARGMPVATEPVADAIEILGVNDRVQLDELERMYQFREARRLLRAGTSLADARRIDIRGELVCGEDVCIDVNNLFEGRVALADGVRVGANCVLIDCEIGPGVEIKPFSHLEGVVVAEGCVIGPFARLRPETRLEAGAKVGNFVETKKARIGEDSKVNHLSYVGDCEMGAGVNIGAGTITCNYDGADKHRTKIGDGAFIGSNSTLVAPVEVEAGGFTAAGSTITRAVGENQLAVSRSEQRNIDDWKRPRKEEKGD